MAHTAFAIPAVVDSLQQKLANFHTMQANFTQKVISKDGNVLQTSKGAMAIQKPGKFRWSVESGVKQLIVTDGQRAWVYDPDLEQVTIRKLALNVADTPVLLLLRPNDYLTNSFTTSKQSNDLFALIPKNNASDFTKITLKFAGNAVQKMTLFNALGQKTSLSFSDIRLNQKLSWKLFHFTPPKNIDVIDEAVGETS